MSTIQDVLKKKMEAKELSGIEIDQGYASVKSFEIMKAAAENPSDGGGAVGGMLAALRDGYKPARPPINNEQRSPPTTAYIGTTISQFLIVA